MYTSIWDAVCARKERFFAKVEKGESCWVWTGNTDTKGYGVLYFNTFKPKKCIKAHRISMMYVLNRELAPDEWVLHHCDNPSCVNPSHLYVGTHEDNMQDMKKRKRSTWGEKSSHAKLSNEQVEDIRCRLANGWTQKEIATELGLAKSTMSYIANNKTYNRNLLL